MAENLFVARFTARNGEYSGMSILRSSCRENAEKYVEEYLLRDSDGEKYFLTSMPVDDIIQVDEILKLTEK